MLSKKIYLYEGREDVSLTTYILDDSPEMLNGKNRGAVLICPGGGYQSCSSREGEPIAMAFAAMGYHAFVLRYSVYNEDKGMGPQPDPSKPIPVKPHCVTPNPMRDIGAAMLCIQKNATEWHVDVDKIALCGFSAGGHNCAMYSVYWDKPVLVEYFGVQMPRPAACILGYAITDYIHMKNMPKKDPFAKWLFIAANTTLFGVAEPTDNQLIESSPARLVSENTPPIFIWTTNEDDLVPARQSIVMAQALAEFGIPFEIHIFESGPHGLSTGTQASAGARSELDADAAKWIDLCGAWLKKRMAFELPELRDWQIAMKKDKA